MAEKSQDKNGVEVTVEHHPEQNFYGVYYEGSETPAALVEYQDRANQRVFYHTGTEAEFGGRGLASIVVGYALQDTAANTPEKHVIPRCPFVKAYIEKNK
ncbi:GNAT family N-acetyltransferase [Corynebacterium caspium]|uniref:GNAT family N-acetyltransferase n=1 Tax=Corynebacterium caspium TaxID=234828 RepID=UPI000362D2C6|nr:GNAT family N-acetyltransferase [Corynebacterium caspium]WKD58842.1 hypothetical protein CCASP_02170 [Corynebacterium caspium DSM 44850]